MGERGNEKQFHETTKNSKISSLFREVHDSDPWLRNMVFGLLRGGNCFRPWLSYCSETFIIMKICVRVLGLSTLSIDFKEMNVYSLTQGMIQTCQLKN